jgi:hypothetical protein
VEDLVAGSSKIRVGVVGLSPKRGFASIAHIPALRALSDFDIAAVCTTRQESAEAAAQHFGIPLAFSIPRKQQTEARNPVLSLRNRKFESISLQERVHCEIDRIGRDYCRTVEQAIEHRDREFESVFLQRTVRLSLEVAHRGRKARLFQRVCGPWQATASGETGGRPAM